MCLERSTLNYNAENRQREGTAWTTPLPDECDGYACVRCDTRMVFRYPRTPSPLPTYDSAKAPGVLKDRPSKDRLSKDRPSF